MVRNSEIVRRIMVDHLKQRLIGAVQALKFHVQHRVDPVFLHQRPEAVFPTEARKDGAVTRRLLGVEIEFGRPPAFDTVLEFRPRAEELVGLLRDTQHGVDGDFEVPGLLEFMIVGNEVRPLGRPQA